MLLPNPAIDEAALAALVAERYGADASRMRFAPVGGDGWHYDCEPFWVSVRRDRQGHTAEAYMAAAELARNGLEFVLAPLADDAGRVVHQVGQFPVIVLPFVAGARHAAGRHRVGRIDCASGYTPLDAASTCPSRASNCPSRAS